jgi:hypothetical protein
VIRTLPEEGVSMPHPMRFRHVCLILARVALGVCLLPSAIWLKGQTLSREYIRLGGRIIAIESPVVTGVSPTSQHVYGGGGNFTASISADSTTFWTASTNPSTWIGFNSLSSGTGSGTLLYGVGANTAGATARSATITISFSTGQNATLTINEDALSSAPPSLTLSNPPSNGVYSSASTQTFTFQASSPNGLPYINHMDFEINNTLYAGGDDCTVTYYPSSAVLYLSQYSGFSQGFTLGTAGTASNYHCIIDLSLSSATITDTSATVTLVVTLQPSAVGTQNVYISATDWGGAQSSSYGVSFGTWLANNELTTSPPTVSMVNPVSSATSQVLYFKFSDGNGFRYIDGNQTVMLAYDAGPNNAPCRATIDMMTNGWGFVYQIVNNAWNFLGSGAIGSGGVIGAGGPCALDFTNSKIHMNPNPTLPDPDPNASLVTDLYLDLSVTLASTAPPVNIYAILIDRAGRATAMPVLVTQWP